MDEHEERGSAAVAKHRDAVLRRMLATPKSLKAEKKNGKAKPAAPSRRAKENITPPTLRKG